MRPTTQDGSKFRIRKQLELWRRLWEICHLLLSCGGKPADRSKKKKKP